MKMANVLTEILQAANKHPNSRVSKLIHTVQEDTTQKNIVLLLIELADHAEFSTDFNISLKYYLELFDCLGINSDLVLNEAGLLLLNSSKIYSKRVDYVQSLVERQILTLSNADHELQQQKLNQQESSTESTTPVEKPKRGRKRALEVHSDPYEVELVPKKFKKLSEEKRFSVQKTTVKAKSIQRNIEMEQHIHPAGWMHATIYDLDNEEDVDTKRNYKLFTYHIEHRYNTLVPDINFRLHFKVKDYIDAQEEEMDNDEACNTDRTWPPLSEAYIQKYLKLENYVLQQDTHFTKRKAMTVEDYDGDEREDMEDFINDNISVIPADISQEKQLNYTANNMEITVQHLNTSIINDSKNDSGLGQSLLDESNKTDTTIDATQLDMANTSLNNTNLESSTANNGFKDTNSIKPDKSLNLTQSLQENDSALGTSLLDQTNNTELNTSTESNCNETANHTTTELSDSSSSLLDQTINTEFNSSTETNENLDSTSWKDPLEEETLEHTTELKKLKDNTDTNDMDSEHLLKNTDIRKDSSSSDDRKFSISTENMPAKKLSDIDVTEKNYEDHSQIRIHLPNMDDEGVYLSDLEEQDHRMFSPSITVTNILPGVQRKDITIIMDEELRKALELRDDIMEHFGREKYYVPVTTEPKKQNLYFNILKLPEKIIRRRVLFKLGPEMDLYLQARSLKRQRIDPQPREYRTSKLLQWFALNNTDMSGITITPPSSPGHCSDFCGFTDDECDNDNDDDDDISCSEFCGFSDEEQSELQLKSLNRLSRDSGVGVDVNQLTPEIEPLEIILEEQEVSTSLLDVANCGKNLSFRKNNESDNESTESILNELSTDIRDALTAEINDEAKDCTETKTCANETDSLVTESTLNQLSTDIRDALTSEIYDEAETETCANQTGILVVDENGCQKLSTELKNSTNNSELTETLSTQNSCALELLNATNTTEETDKLSRENSIDNAEQGLETLVLPDEHNSDVVQESQELATNLEINHEVSGETNNDVQLSCDQSENTAEVNKTAENENKNCDKNNIDLNNTFDYHHANDDGEDSEDDTFLNLDTHGTKTKIQLWHEHLQPILAKSRERHHFDVFKMGTEIIETVQTKKQTVEETLSSSSTSSHHVALFHDIMDNKDKSYVSRYFLSTLLLANQSNVEISVNNQSSEHPSSWNDIQLKLLSTKRHTVAIEDNIGMINNNKKTTQKESEKMVKTKTKTKENKQCQMEVDDEEDDKPLVKQQKTIKKVKTSYKRSSENAIFAIAEKKLKETSTTTQQKSTNESSTSLITNVQILPTLTTRTGTTNDNTSFSLLSSFGLPQSNVSTDMPCTSRQTQDLQELDVNLNSIRTLQPIQKVPRNSDDYDSGVFSIDELST